MLTPKRNGTQSGWSRGAVAAVLASVAGLVLMGSWIGGRLSTTWGPQAAVSIEEPKTTAPAGSDEVAPLPVSPEPQAATEPDASRTELASELAATDGFVHGLVASEDGEAFAGLTVTLSSLFDDLASTRTDSQGRFAIPNPKRGSRRLFVELPDGWSCGLNPRKLTRDEREGQAAVEVEIFPRESDPVRGRLTDAASELGVPGYAVRVVAADQQEVVVTDDAGRFETSASFEHGAVSWHRLKDADSTSRGVKVFEGLHSGEPISLEIEVGPTYRLMLSPTEARSDDLTACLIEPDRSPWGSGWGSFDAWDALSGWNHDSVPVTDLDTVLRFPARDRAHRYTRLILFSESTGWFASVDVPAGAQVHPDPIRALLERQSVLTVEFDSPVATTRALVTVRDDQDRERMIPGSRPLIVRPGTYELLATDPRHESHREGTALLPGPALRRITLNPIEVGGAISGMIRTRSGDSPEVFVALKSINSERTLLGSEVGWKKGVGSFEVPDVPTGTYRLELMSSTVFEWSPSSLQVEPPRTNLEFTLLDDVETCPWDIEVTAADTGDRLRPDVRVHVSGVRQPFEAGPRPIDAEFEYTIRAADYQLYRGYHTDFERTEVDGAPHRIARIALQPGWRLYVDVQDEQGRAVQGAELVIDDEVVAVTDSTGHADVSRADMPGRLVVRKAGFVEQPVSPYSGEGLVQLARE